MVHLIKAILVGNNLRSIALRKNLHFNIAISDSLVVMVRTLYTLTV